MFCLLYSPKQKNSWNFTLKTQKQIGKSHVIDIFTSEDMENISLCIFQYLTLYYIINGKYFTVYFQHLTLYYIIKLYKCFQNAGMPFQCTKIKKTIRVAYLRTFLVWSPSPPPTLFGIDWRPCLLLSFSLIWWADFPTGYCPIDRDPRYLRF
jgi:hypothetical protein